MSPVEGISSVGSKLFLRTYHTENQKLLRTFTTPNALLSLILKMLGRMPTYCMPVAYPMPATHPRLRQLVAYSIAYTR